MGGQERTRGSQVEARTRARGTMDKVLAMSKRQLGQILALLLFHGYISKKEIEDLGYPPPDDNGEPWWPPDWEPPEWWPRPPEEPPTPEEPGVWEFVENYQTWCGTSVEIWRRYQLGSSVYAFWYEGEGIQKTTLQLIRIEADMLICGAPGPGPGPEPGPEPQQVWSVYVYDGQTFSPIAGAKFTCRFTVMLGELEQEFEKSAFTEHEEGFAEIIYEGEIAGFIQWEVTHQFYERAAGSNPPEGEIVYMTKIMPGLHEPLTPERGLFVCPICGIEFTSRDEYLWHSRGVHQGP